MKVRIYQIDMDADKDNLAFRNLEFVYKKAGGRVPEEINRRDSALNFFFTMVCSFALEITFGFRVRDSSVSHIYHESKMRLSCITKFLRKAIFRWT